MKLVELRLKLIYIGKNGHQCASVLRCSFPSGKTLPFADHRPSLSLKPWKARVVKKAICTHRKLARAPTHVSVRARLVSRLLACWMLARPSRWNCFLCRKPHLSFLKGLPLSLSLSLSSSTPPLVASRSRAPSSFSCGVVIYLIRVGGPRGLDS